MRHVLVTGASGFVGGAVVRRLLAEGCVVRAAVHLTPVSVAGVEQVRIGEVGPQTDWREALADIDAVVHLAARVHQLRDVAADPLADFRRVNTAGTLHLALAAAKAAVKRLVFVSSVKVNGEGGERAFRTSDPPAPEDPYGLSKKEAEEQLAAVAGENGLEVVIVRPPLVYGPGMKANMARLWRAVDRGLPLPLGGIDNRRSLVYVENLADCLARCVTHSRAAGRTFLVSDFEDVSTTALIRQIADALGRSARLVAVPPFLLRLAGRLTGRRAAVGRLVGSLFVDPADLERELGWHPPYSMAEGMKETATWYRSHR